ncbi:DgyrCDS9260 [Dimorphilus gyrociliatus]|uniref:DgyrCDS9260 n=1 Tax=Dimorphilus gyrociliatus TaxID=2664684 RepID=A0A7I8VXY9_9ANNE|nr:DgyrCDS9260 [Dimorphilus gyrociliatus]
MNEETQRFDCRETEHSYYDYISQQLGYPDTAYNPVTPTDPNGRLSQNLPDTPPESERSEPYSPPEQLINDQPPPSKYGLPIYSQTVSNPTYAPTLNTRQEEGQKTKKRKIDENLQQSSLVKCERDTPNHCQSADSDSGQNSLKFYVNHDEKFYVLYDSGGNALPHVNFSVEADKGFIFSAPDDSFICQKKNHFQVTVHLANNSYYPKFVATNQNNYEEIRSFHIHIYGNKREAKQQTVQVEQSQSDRTKKPFVPQIIEFSNSGTAGKGCTIGRLHFCDTTLNNQRKNGKPNPDQRYFLLNVALKAHTLSGNEWTICSMQSEKIIVRASNPSQFKQDVDPWQKVQGSESVYSSGNVGIKTDKPEKALDVQGDIRVTGAILQPSDMRVKENIKEVDSSEQLEKVKKVKMYNFSYKDDYADAVGMEAQERQTTGVLAQQVKTVIPEAVHPAGDVKLTNGEVVENFQTVNKDRLYMEGLGAVQELCKVADNLQTRIVQIETFNERLKQKRDSVRSTTSSVISSPVLGSEGSRARRPNQNKLNRANSFKNTRRSKKPSQPEDTQCSNRLLHSAIVTLVFVMTLCLISILTLYILEKTEKKGTSPIPTIITRPGTPAVTRGTVKPTPIPPDVLIRSFCRINVCDEKCCLSSSSRSGNKSHIQSANVIREESNFRTSKFTTMAFTMAKMPDRGKTHIETNENIRHIMADPYFITYNRSLAPFCLRNSCTGSDGRYRYLIKLDKTIQFRNIIVNLKLNNASVSVSWLCHYSQGTGADTETDCEGTQLQHLPFRDELRQDIWSLPAGYFNDTIYTFRISSKLMNNTCDLSQDRMGIDFTEYDFHFKRLPSRTCPK